MILIAATLLRAYGVGSGLPYIYDPDEPVFVKKAVYMLVTGDLNPHWFGHPGTVTISTLALSYLGYGLSWFGSLADLSKSYEWDPSVFHGIGRAVILLSAIGNLTILWLVGRKIVRGWVALLAVAVLAVAPLHISLSTTIRTDIQQSAMILLVVYFALAVAREGRWRDYLASGMALGLAVMTKYPAVIAASGVVAGYLLRVSEAGFRQTFPSEFVKLVAAGAISVVTAFVASPYWFLDFGTALNDVLEEAQPYHLGATSDGVLSTLLFYVGKCRSNLTAGGLVLAIVGMIATLRRSDRSAWVLVVVPLAYMIFLSLHWLRWTRWAVPLLPFLAIFAAIGVDAILGWTKRFIPQPWLALFALFVIAVWLSGLLVAGIKEARRATLDDTRSAAARWVEENLPRNSNILAERYTPQLRQGLFNLFTVAGGHIVVHSQESKYVVPKGVIGRIDEIKDVETHCIDYIILGNDYARRKNFARQEGRVIQKYLELFSRLDQIAQFERSNTRVGPQVTIYKVKRYHSRCSYY